MLRQFADHLLKLSFLHFLLLLLLLSQPIQLMGQTADGSEIQTFVGHFNPDAFADTLYCREYSETSFLPSTIVWGRDSTVNGRNRITRFRYPGWRGLSGSVACLKFNQDTLTDIILFLFGSDTTQGNRRDTLRHLVVFGQERLATRTQVVITEVQRTQTQPFFALDLSAGVHLIEPRGRDASRRTSYRLAYPDVNVGDTSSPLLPSAAARDGDHASGWVKIYPNPAVYSTTLEAKLAANGTCRVRLIATDGATEFDRSIRVDASGLVFEHIDLSDVPSGFYELRIDQTGRSPRQYPLIVVR